MEPLKKDWKLYQEKIVDWQEAYTERLIKEYVDYLNGDESACTKFWEMEKRIKMDRKSPGVCIELNKGDMLSDLVRLIKGGVITFDDLDAFSDELKESVKFLQQRQ